MTFLKLSSLVLKCALSRIIVLCAVAAPALMSQAAVSVSDGDVEHPERALGLDFSLPEEQGKDKG